MEEKDYYKILGVSKDDSKDVIKKKYKKLAMKYHPDKSNGSDKEKNEEKFKEISEAYSVLGDEKKRDQYDSMGHSSFSSGYGSQDYGNSQGFGGGDFDSILRDLFGQKFGGSGGSDFFHENRDMKFGEDLRVGLKIEFEEAVFGCEHEINIKKKNRCESCNGSGAKDESVEKCETCDGRGRVIINQRTPFGIVRQERVCEDCEGEGEVPKVNCGTCYGSGIILSNKRIKVRIPKGINANQILRVEGEGNAIKNGQNGDLQVVIQIKGHKVFRREGDNIFMDYSISFSQAAMGCKVLIPTLFGDQKVKVVAGTNSGTILRLSNKGVPHLNSYGTGDQFVTLKIQTPKKLTRDQKKLFKELAALEEE